MSMDLITWLRETCAKYTVAPAAVFQKAGNIKKWPITIKDEADLYAQLHKGGHFLPLPKEPAALANILEVSICDFLISRIAETPGLEFARGTERHYPDLELCGPALGGKYYAVDIKVAQRKPLTKSTKVPRTKSRITLYTGNTYFMYQKLKWPGTFRPFEDYEEHLDVIALYDLNVDGVHRVDNLELVVQEAWRIGSKQRSSTTREYIGAVDSIEDLVKGRGEFHSKDAFYKYWQKHPFKVGNAVKRQLEKLLKQHDGK